MSASVHKLLESFVTRMYANVSLAMHDTSYGTSKTSSGNLSGGGGGGGGSSSSSSSSSSGGGGSSSGASPASAASALSPIFITDENRKLRQTIEDQSRHLSSQRAFSDLITQLISSGYDLLSNADLRYKVVAIAVLDCLLDVELRNDDLQGRRQAIVNRLKLETFENPKIGNDHGGALVLRAAAQLVGHLARIANPYETEYLYQFLFMWSFDQLKRGKQFKLAGALVVTQIANNSPNLVFKHHKDNKTSAMGMGMWDVVCDRVPVVREAAAEALEACLQVISGREIMDPYLTAAFTQIDAGFAANSTEKVIGSLLICDIIVAGNVVSNDGLHAAMRKLGKEFSSFVHRILQLFTETKANTLSQTDVRQKAIDIVPKLAAAFQYTFVQPNQLTNPHNFLNFTISNLLALISNKNKSKDDKERPLAYISLGKLVVAMAQQLRQSQQMQDIFRVIKDGLRDQLLCVNALQCLAMVTNVSQSIRKFVDKETVGDMFLGGLTGDLIECLKVVTKHVASVSGWVQSQLLYHIKSILRSYAVTVDDGPRAGRVALSRALGSMAGSASSSSMPPSSSSSSSASSASSSFAAGGVKASPAKQWLNPFSLRQHEALTPLQAHNSEAQLVLSLQVLASPDFFRKRLRGRDSPSTQDKGDEGSLTDLLRVVQEAVVRYLDDFNSEIRGAAVLTCAKVLDTVVLGIEPSSPEYSALFQVIDRLLMIGVGDDLMEIRLAVFTSLAPSLDATIAQSENVHCLVEALNDEAIEVRVAAMNVFARVAQFNALHFMPAIRVLIERFVRELQNRELKSRSESAQLLQALVMGANTLIVPYLDVILEPLMLLLDDPSPFIHRTALSTIGDLSVASPESIKGRLDSLFPHLIKSLDEASSVANQEAAVEAMGKLVSSLTMVTEEPYSRYPGLFEGLVGIIHKENVPELRLKAIRSAGLLGAVDAKVYQTQMRNFTGVVEIAPPAAADEEEEDELPAAGKRDRSKTTKIERHYLAVVMNNLVAILRNSDLSPTHHKSAAQSAISVMRSLGSQALPMLEPLLDGLHLRISHPDTEALFRDTLLDHIKSLIFILGRAFRKHSSDVVKLLCAKLPEKGFANSTLFESHLRACLDIVESFGLKMSRPDFNLVLQAVVPIMLEIMNNEPHAESMLLDEGPQGRASVADGVLHGPGAIITMSSQLASKRDSGRQMLSSGGFVTAVEPKGRKLPLPKTAKILQTVANMTENLSDYRRIFIPAVIRILDEKDTTESIRRDALVTLMHLAKDLGNGAGGSRGTGSVHEYASRIMHPLMRIVSAAEPGLQKAALTALSCLVCRLGTDYVPYIIPVRRKLKSLAIGESHPCVQHLDEYDTLVNFLLKQRPLPAEASTAAEIAVRHDDHVKVESARLVKAAAYKVDPASLEQAWALAGRNSSTDLEKWMRRLSLELIRQSPSPIIRDCADIAKTYQPLAEDLFNISFYCMWDELFDESSSGVLSSSTLIRSIELALRSPHKTEKITNALLHLSEFMDMQDRSLPLDVRLLGQRAEQANMYAKSLRYREAESNSAYIPPSEECIEALITVNNQLGLEDRAAGVLKTVINTYPDIAIEPLWLEKLSRWDDARQSYVEENFAWRENKPNGAPPQYPKWMASELGMLRCLHALGEYDELASSATELKEALSQRDAYEDAVQQQWMHQVQRLGANAAWMLGKWDLMDTYLTAEGETAEDLPVIELDNNLSFYRTIVAIHKADYPLALSLISDSRSHLSGAISSLLSEGYSRAYRAMVTMQILAELEEVVEFKQAEAATVELSGERALSSLFAGDARQSRQIRRSASQSFQLQQADIYIPRSPSGQLLPDLSAEAAHSSHTASEDLAARKAALIRKWRGRLKWAPKEVDVYRQIIAVHTLVADPLENLDSWLELVTLCRKEGMFSLCENILRRLGAPLGAKSAALVSEVTSSDEVVAQLLDSPREHTPTTPHTPASDLSDNMYPQDAEGYSQTPLPTFSPAQAAPPNKRVIYSYHKYLWASGDKERALVELSNFINSSAMSNGGAMGGLTPYPEDREARTFRARCLLKRAEWLRDLDDDHDEDILKTVFEARELTSDHYAVWHAWAVTNFDQLKKVAAEQDGHGGAFSASLGSPSHHGSRQNLRTSGSAEYLREMARLETASTTSQASSNGGRRLASPDYFRRGGVDSPSRGLQRAASASKLSFGSAAGAASLAGLIHHPSKSDEATRYVVEAIRGFVRSITLGQGQPVSNVLQDTLRLLTLWFTYGTKEWVAKIAESEMAQVAPENWLDVIPQLIARMHIKTKEISLLLRQLLTQVAGIHPQALVCPISVALNTSIEQQKVMAAHVLHEMRVKGPQLVVEATMVSRELLLVATSPHELWCDGLEKAAALYSGKDGGKESLPARVELMVKTLRGDLMLISFLPHP